MKRILLAIAAMLLMGISKPASATNHVLHLTYQRCYVSTTAQIDATWSDGVRTKSGKFVGNSNAQCVNVDPAWMDENMSCNSLCCHWTAIQPNSTVTVDDSGKLLTGEFNIKSCSETGGRRTCTF